MTPLAFLTLRDRTGYCIYDELAVPPLNALGYSVREVPWDEAHDWSQYAAVILRSPWDYTERLAEFLETLAGIERATRLLNGLEVIRWNSNKLYLRELEAAGVPIVPTHFGEGLDERTLAQGYERFGCDELVVKPLVSANARGTIRVPRDGSGTQAALATHGIGAHDIATHDIATHGIGAHDIATPGARGFMLQPFVPSVLSEGEVSLFYFAGEYSHAVRKRPKAGDFRVQEEHGGILARLEADESLRDAATRALSRVRWPLLQARVDLVFYQSAWRVMELELIEPSLYFPLDAESPGRFAAAVHRTLSAGGGAA